MNVAERLPIQPWKPDGNAAPGPHINGLKDLKGHSFAFGDINSTSGHLMPFEPLRRAGINPDTDLQFH